MAGLDPNRVEPPKPRVPRAVALLRRYEEADAQAARESFKQETLAEPGFWESALESAKSAGLGALSALGAAMENTPFAGVPETLGGLASYPAEWLGRATGAGRDGAGAADFEDMTVGGVAANLNPIGLLANAVGLGTGSSQLRRRGREFLEKASRGLAAEGPNTKALLAAAGPVGTAAVAVNEGLEWLGIADEAPLTAIGMGQGGKTDEFLYRVGLETAASGPLNIMPAGGTEFIGSIYNAAKASRAGAWMIERFPRAALLPERVWLKVSGANKKAAVLGDEQMQRLYVAQQAFEDESAPAFMRLYQDILAEEKGRYAKLNLAPEQEQVVRGGVLELAEQPADWRKVYAARMSDQQVVQDALVEMADLYGDQAARIAALENKYHIATKDLVSDLFEYAQRQFTPELRAWTLGNPTARQILTGTKRRLDVQQFETAWAGFERARKLGDLDIKQAEAVLRADLAKAGLPENIPIFSRDAFGDLAKRAEADIRRAKVRNLYVAASDVFGQSLDQSAVRGIVQAVLDEKQARAWKRAADEALGAMDARDVAEGFKAGRGALREAGKEARAAGRWAQSAENEADKAVAALRGQWRDVKPGEVLEPGARVRLDLGTGRSQVFDGGVAGTLREGVELADQLGAEAAQSVKSSAADDFLDAARAPAYRVAAMQRLVREYIRPGVKQSEAMARAARQLPGSAVMLDAEDVVRQFANEAANLLERGFSDGTGVSRDMLKRGREAVQRYYDSWNAVRDNWWAANPDAIWPRDAADYFRGTLRDYQRVAKAFADELEGIAPAALGREFQKLAAKGARAAQDIERHAARAIQRDVAKLGSEMRRALAALDKPALLGNRAASRADVAAQAASAADDLLAVGAAQAAGGDVGQLVRGAARDADKAAEAALQRAQDMDPAKWSAEVKALWVDTVVRRAGISGPPRSMSALQLLKDKKVPLPDNLDDLTRLATTFVDDADAAKLQKYIENFYSRDHRPGAIGRYYDGLKQIYQRSVLGRPASLSKDLIGTTSQGFIAGNTAADLARAVADLGGNPVTWAEGVGKAYRAPDDVLRLMAEGVLQTTKEEALAKGAFEGVPVLGRVEELGVLGALVPGKAGRAVSKATDSLLATRVWYEQTHRLATYRRAIREGMDHRAAVEEVYKHFGQFNELTKLERTALNRILFFWTWMARSVPVAVRNLLDHPIRSRLLLALMAHGEQGAPDWFNRMGGYALGVDDTGNVDAIGTGGSTYFSPLFSLLQGDMAKAIGSGDLGAAISGAGMDVVRATPPFVQAGGELLQRQDYFTGEKWEDEQGHSNVKAPMAFWWLMNHAGEPNAIERALGLTAKTDKEGNLRGLTIKPEFGWLLQALPGVDVAATDVSAFVDPRQTDASGVSLGKGVARQAGFPVYRFHMDDQQDRNVREFRTALHKEVGKLSGGGLDIVYGRVSPTFQTLRGQKINHDVAVWRKEAQEQGLGPRAARAYVDQRMARLYQAEWRLIELDRRLAILQQQASAAAPADDLLVGLAG